MSSHWVFMSLCYFVLCTDLLPQLSGSVTGCLSFFPSGGLVFLLVRMVLILELIPHLPRPSLGFLPVGLAWAHLCINVESRTCAVQGNWPGDVRCRQLATCLTSAGWGAHLKNPGARWWALQTFFPGAVWWAVDGQVSYIWRSIGDLLYGQVCPLLSPTLHTVYVADPYICLFTLQIILLYWASDWPVISAAMFLDF